MHYANSIQDTHDPKRLELKQKCYDYIIKTFPKATQADSAMFYRMAPYYPDRYAEAIPLLEAYWKKFPKGKYAELAKEFLKTAKEKSKNESFMQ